MRLATVHRSAEQTAQFLGVVDALLDRIDIRLSLAEQADWDRQLATIRAQLTEPIFTRAWARGRAMLVEQCCGSDSKAIDLPVPARPPPPPP